MKRLLAQTGIMYFSVLAVAFYLSELSVIVLASCAAVSSIILLIVRKTRKTIYVPAMAIAALIACMVNLGYTYLAVKPIEAKYADGFHHVEARLTEEPYKSYSMFYYRLTTASIDGTDERFDLLLKLPYRLEADVDDTLRFDAKLTLVENDYYRSKGYYLNTGDYDTHVDVIKAKEHTLYYRAVLLRRSLRQVLSSLLPEDCATLCRAVLVGDKYALDRDIREDFRYAGASYFIVVSGMHFAVLCLLVLRLCRRLLPRYAAFGVSVLFLLLYMAVTGFQPSVLRSGIMMFIYMLGLTIRRQVYSLNHLGIAGVLMPFIVSPYGAGDIGLILSFYATMAILLWASPIARRISFKDEYDRIYRFHTGGRVRCFFRRLRQRMKKEKPDPYPPFELALLPKKLWNTIASLLSVSLAANILTFPLSVVFFRAFSLVTLISALFLYALIYLILVLSLAVCVLYFLGPLRFLSILLSWVLYGACRLVLWIVGFLGNLPFSYIHIRSGFFYIWLAITVILGICVLLFRGRARVIPIAIFGSVIVLLAVLLTDTVTRLNTLSLEVYSCGDGLCAGVDSGGDLYLLSLSAKSRERYAVLQKLSDRYGGAEVALCADGEYLDLSRYSDREFAISDYLMYDSSAADADDSYIRFDDDATFILDDDLILYLFVEDDRVIPYLEANGRSILLIPDGCTADDIPDALRAPDIAVVTKSFTDGGALTCTDMIVSGSESSSHIAADELRQSYDNVFLTCEGDVSYNLR